MKKSVYVLLGFILALSICSCKGKKNKVSDLEEKSIESVSENNELESSETVSEYKEPEWTKIENLRESVNSDVNYKIVENRDFFCLGDSSYKCEIVCCIPEIVGTNELMDMGFSEHRYENGFYKYSNIWSDNDVLEKISDYKYCIDVYHNDDYLFSFNDKDEYYDYGYDVLNPSFSKDNIYLIIAGIAAYRNIGFIENERFHSILEYSDEDRYDYRSLHSEESVTNYDIIFTDDEIRILFYSYNIQDENSAKPHGYICKMLIDSETNEHSFSVEKINLE